VVQEVDRQRMVVADADDVIAGIRTAIATEHQIRPHAVLLVDVLCIPTTSSGKIRRSACKQKFLDGRLDAFAQWLSDVRSAEPVLDGQTHPFDGFRESEDRLDAALSRANHQERQRLLTEYLRHHLAVKIEMVPSHVDVEQPLISFGIDSLMAAELRAQI